MKSSFLDCMNLACQSELPLLVAFNVSSCFEATPHTEVGLRLKVGLGLRVPAICLMLCIRGTAAVSEHRLGEG